MSKKEKANKIVEPAEDSIGLRIVACSIALLCIITACVYVNTQQLLVFLYLWGALTGSYVSYQFRNQKFSFWTIWITYAGLAIVLGNFVEEAIFQYMAGKIHPLVPFIHVLTGLQSLHTFDLRAKSDINISALIGIGLFACTAVLGKDLNFAYITLAYISLGAALLYYESVSRTLKAGNLGKASEDPDLPVPQAPAQQGQATGSVFLPLSLVPVLSVIIFFALPRVESLFDMLIENARRAQAGEQLTFKFVKEPNGLGLLSASQNAAVDPSDGKSTAKGYSLVPSDKGGGKGINLNQGAAPGGSATGTNQKPGGFGPTGAKKGASGKGAKAGASKGKEVPPTPLAAKPPPPLPPRNLDEEDKQMIFHNKDSAAHDEDVILRVTTSQDTYLRRMCFDNYDGHKWTTTSPGKISKCAKGSGTSYQELAGVPSLFVSPQLPAAEISQEITVETDIGHSIPVTSIPQRMSFPFDPITVDQFGTLHSTKALIKGTIYRITSKLIDYDVAAMRKAPADQALQKKAAADYGQDLQLPKELSPAVVSLAKDKAGNDGNWFARAERICNFLRSNYKYSLDDEPQSDQEICYDFLFQKKQGACGPFATSFIVMCRATGIPTRCVGGFAPGDFDQNTGSRAIRNKHGHAWAEVYVPGYDWVPFDATPNGMLPKPMEEDHSILGAIKKNLEAIQVKFSPPPPEPPRIKEVSPDRSKLATAATSDKSDQQNKSTWPTNGSQGSGTAGNKSKGGSQETGKTIPAPTQTLDWHTLVLIPIIVPALMLLFQAMQAAVRQARNRVRKHVEKPKMSTILFLKVTDDLKKLKINRLPSDTPEELLARFSEATQPSATFHPDLTPLCKRFMELYCADRFGCDDASEVRQEQLKSVSQQIHELIRANPSKN